MTPMFLSENADAKLMIQRINSLVDAYLSLDERIARFETGAAYERAEPKLSEADLICIKRAKKQANYLIQKLSDINFSSAHEATRFAKDGIEHIIIDLDRFEDDSQ